MRLIIVSNRAPISIIKDNGKYGYKPSTGGLATGLGAYVERMKKTDPGMEIIWVGWPGTEVDDEQKVGKEIQQNFGIHSVFLSEQMMERFYEGFCNKTIWPLFHYFPVYASYEKENWEEYISVNKIFCEAILKILLPGDVVWIHDYHLMLLPGMIRKAQPDATIGFFLHIPFPAYEIFRLLPSEWRKKILEGIYGADLIGFHTFDYRTYFLRSTMNILGLPESMGEVFFERRLVKVDSFPMGIDYNKYHQSIRSKEVGVEKKKLIRNILPGKFILSLDRQDYSKGILNRLRAYEYFLQMNPQWVKRVTMLLVVVPSRAGVENYMSIRKQIDELVGHVNGVYGRLDWQPIHYQYRSLSFNELIAMYNFADVALVTPLRDGMNLVSKEFIASKIELKGVLILSEMAGAVKELDEAIIINPNNIEEISQSMLIALEMNEQEQARRLSIMQKRVKRYTVFVWADDFLNSLKAIKNKQEHLKAIMLGMMETNKIISDYHQAGSRILFLDYDGTLVEHASQPELAAPDKELMDLLHDLTQKENTSVILISGRNKAVLDMWFGKLPVAMVAEHGVFLKEKNQDWRLIKPIRRNWKKRIHAVMNQFVEKLPGSFVEEKEYTLVYHYRKAEHDLADLRVKELATQLMGFTSNMEVQMVMGSKILEIRNSGIDKGVAALHWLSKSNKQPLFVLAIGNDQTDEDLFRSMPPDAVSIKVGTYPSHARFNLSNPIEVRSFLRKLL